MEIIKVNTINGVENAKVYNVHDFPYDDLKDIELLMTSKRASKKRNKRNYYNLICSFDIETTTIKPKIIEFKNNKTVYEFTPYAFMYQWQFAIGYRCIFGRTWEEFTFLLNKLHETLNTTKENNVVVWCHNLPYEFQFCHQFLKIDSVFAKAKRKPIRVNTTDGFEFRCSLALSNMSLAKFCENYNAVHYKKLDLYDYSKMRTYKTELTEIEKDYCYCDVIGLNECIRNIMAREGDTLLSIPMTNTGYVRNAFRAECLKNKRYHEILRKCKLTDEDYFLLQRMFRGGNCHANRYYIGQIMENVKSKDKQSSYPSVIATKEFPMSKWYDFKDLVTDFETRGKDACVNDFYSYMYGYDYSGHKENDWKYIHHAAIGCLWFKNLKVRDDVVIPYIDVAHCEKIIPVYPGDNAADKKPIRYHDNGRVLLHQNCWTRIPLTNIDFQIIASQYSWDELKIEDFKVCTTKLLPIEIRKCLMDFFYAKTLFKGDDEKAYEYMKSKNRLNSAYGMMVQSLLNALIVFDPEKDEWNEQKIEDAAEQIEQYYHNFKSFLSYSWGIFVTSWARYELQTALDYVGEDCIYTDTDSVKYINSEKYDAWFDERNEYLIELAKSVSPEAFCVKDGIEYVLGTWDDDGYYKRFRTWGAKKYAFEKIVTNKDTGEDELKFEITVSGMSKKKGSKAVGCIENFELGKTFADVGRTVSWYNDEHIHTITVDGATFLTASNIGILDTTYTLDITEEMRNVVEMHYGKLIVHDDVRHEQDYSIWA